MEDAAEGCVFLMKKYHKPDPINLGIGRETSINQLARLVQSTVGFRGQLKFDTAKPDGNLRRLLDSRKIHALGWRAKVSLESGLQRTYDWYRKHLDGKAK